MIIWTKKAWPLSEDHPEAVFYPAKAEWTPAGNGWWHGKHAIARGWISAYFKFGPMTPLEGGLPIKHYGACLTKTSPLRVIK